MERHQAADFLFLGSMLENEKSKVFVDDVHYNEATNRRIAEAVVDALLRLPGPAVPESKL